MQAGTLLEAARVLGAGPFRSFLRVALPLARPAVALGTGLALMEALSQAAAEITAAMPTGGVDVRLDGRDLDFVVDAAPPVPPAPPAPPAPPRAEEPEEDASVARITLRLPESLKTKAEDAAANLEYAQSSLEEALDYLDSAAE